MRRSSSEASGEIKGAAVEVSDCERPRLSRELSRIDLAATAFTAEHIQSSDSRCKFSSVARYYPPAVAACSRVGERRSLPPRPIEYFQYSQARRRQDAFFFGTFAPFLRASDSPIAIACLRLVTLPPLPPLPERSVPRFSRCIALSTDLPAALPYFRPPDFFFAAIRASRFTDKMFTDKIKE